MSDNIQPRAPQTDPNIYVYNEGETDFIISAVPGFNQPQKSITSSLLTIELIYMQASGDNLFPELLAFGKSEDGPWNFVTGWSSHGEITYTYELTYSLPDDLKTQSTLYMRLYYDNWEDISDPITVQLPGSSITIDIPSGSEVRYITDGSTPTASSELATETIQVPIPSTVKAKAFVNDGSKKLNSKVATLEVLGKLPTPKVSYSGTSQYVIKLSNTSDFSDSKYEGISFYYWEDDNTNESSKTWSEVVGDGDPIIDNPESGTTYLFQARGEGFEDSEIYDFLFIPIERT